VEESRCRLRAIFAFQNGLRVLGVWPHFGQPCQKQPSTNTASRGRGKKKSGRPATPVGCIRHPAMPARTRPSLRGHSVERLLLPRMDDIIRERVVLTPVNWPSFNFDLRKRSTGEQSQSNKATA
jgi:hypothetical protein